MEPRDRSTRIGTDIGGTFTDFVAIDGSGRLWLEKTLTTPQDPAQGIFNGLEQLAGRQDVPLSQCRTLVHGTTLVINALIERKGCRTALITTRGFRDVLEMRTELRYDVYDLQLEFPRPLVPRELRLELDERSGPDGAVLRRPSPDAIRALVQQLQDAGVEAVGVCLLNAHVNAANERAVGALINELAPGLSVSLSSDVLPRLREYERTSTTVANAYVQPVVAAYLQRLDLGLRQRGFSGDLFCVQSGGGVVSKEAAQAFPIRMLESGPAGGVAAARWWGALLGEKDLLSFDMGGTTAKLCSVIDGEALVTDEYEAARLHHFKPGSGLAINVPVLDLLEIGTGGGSIAHVDKLGLIKVGPISAGASPGPACYGLGGDRPTVTDADVVLGYLDPRNFLGGSMQLHPGRASTVIERDIAAARGLSDLQEAAYRIHDLANEDMASAARLHLAERGIDATRLTMVAFGGAGPVHAHGVAEKLGIPRVAIPPAAGVMSALGMLVEDLSTDRVRSFLQPLARAPLRQMRDTLGQMEAEAASLLKSGSPNLDCVHSVELRYKGQGYSIRVVVPREDAWTEELRPRLRDRFEAAYARQYGRVYGDVDIEVVNLRLVARVRRDATFQPMRLETAGPGETPRPRTRRAAYFGPRHGQMSCQVYERAALKSGHRADGPAFIEERETTIVVRPDARFHVDPLGIVIIHTRQAGGQP